MILQRLKRWLSHMNQLPCYKCGSRKTTETDHDYINHTVCEYKVVCADCGHMVNYWAYGNLTDPDTYTDLFWMRWTYFKYRLEKLLRRDKSKF